MNAFGASTSSSAELYVHLPDDTTEGETHQLVRCLWIWIFVFPVWEVLLFCAFRYFRSVIRKEKTAHATKEEGVPSVA